MSAVATAFAQIAAGDGAIKDIEALRNNMPKEIQNSNFAESWRSQPVKLFRLTKFTLPLAVSGDSLVTVFN